MSNLIKKLGKYALMGALALAPLNHENARAEGPQNKKLSFADEYLAYTMKSGRKDYTMTDFLRDSGRKLPGSEIESESPDFLKSLSKQIGENLNCKYFAVLSKKFGDNHMYGSGFIYKNYLITAEHVARMFLHYEDFDVVLMDDNVPNKLSNEDVVLRDCQKDIAIIKLHKPKISANLQTQCEGGERITMYGTPGSQFKQKLEYSGGKIINPRTKISTKYLLGHEDSLENDLQGISYRSSNGKMYGYSGGPIVNKNGEVLGMTLSEDHTLPINHYALSAREIEDSVKEADKRIKNSSRNSD